MGTMNYDPTEHVSHHSIKTKRGQDTAKGNRQNADMEGRGKDMRLRRMGNCTDEKARLAPGA